MKGVTLYGKKPGTMPSGRASTALVAKNVDIAGSEAERAPHLSALSEILKVCAGDQRQINDGR